MSLRVSILGIGKMGKNHLRVLSMLKGVVVAKIFDFNEDELKSLSQQYSVPYTLNADEALENVDAAIIVTPTSTHFDYFKLCVGKVTNVFVEKPLAESLAEAQEIEALAKSNNMFVQCGFIERFNPVVAELKKILKSTNVINSDFFRTNRLSSRITDVDVVLDLMIHDIDLALYLNGPIIDIVAYGNKENGLVAFASAIFKHQNGSLSRIIASRMTEKKIRSIQVTTEDAYIDAELLRKELQVHKQSAITRDTDDSYIVSSLEQQIEVKPQEALLVELQAFISRCNGDKSVDLPDIEAGVESLRVCKLVLESIENV
ncbi:MAG: Gfo/Idh/MocA family oxidoreductase [Porticoccaceae bacterium]|nr:Gfo/Idh/MocA family oxidoreductase [Porticoccaceae bacterium]